MVNYLCSRDCAEDIGANLKQEFLQIENLKFCSPDTLLRLQKSLALDKEVMDIVEDNSERFYIRGQGCGELSNKVKDMKDWKTVRIGLFDVEACSIDNTPFGGEKTYRYVVDRQKNGTGQAVAFFGDDFHV